MTISDFGIKGRLITNPELHTKARTGEPFLPVTLEDWSGKMRVIFTGKKAIEYAYLIHLFNFFPFNICFCILQINLSISLNMFILFVYIIHC